MSQTLLIIDDDQAIHALVDLHLSGSLTKCLSAYDGVSGIALAQAQKPDAILLDMDMPLLNGYEVCQRLKADFTTRDIPVIFVTAASKTADKVQGIDLGAVDYITKPFDPLELQARVRSAMRMRRTVAAAVKRTAVDELTGLFNRSYLERRLEADLATARRSGRPLACALAEIDQLDELIQPSDAGAGKAEGVLLRAGEAIIAALRLEDVVCRYDARRFAVLAFVSDRTTALELAHRIRGAVASITTDDPPAAKALTCSVGLALSRFSFGKSLLHCAEQALSDARSEGGDRAVFSNELVELRAAGAPGSEWHGANA